MVLFCLRLAETWLLDINGSFDHGSNSIQFIFYNSMSIVQQQLSQRALQRQKDENRRARCTKTLRRSVEELETAMEKREI